MSLEDLYHAKRKQKEKEDEAKNNQIQKELAQGRAAQQENERNKQALATLETTDKERIAAVERADRLAKELAELKSSQSLSTNKEQDLDRALKLCMEDKTKAEGNCHDQLSGLNPQQSYDEI